MSKGSSMPTGLQIRMARAALRWSAEDLADRAGLNPRTVLRIEQHDDVSSSSLQTLASIKGALEAEGIEFIGSLDGTPGVRIRFPNGARSTFRLTKLAE